MNIAVGSLQQEANSFCPLLADETAFDYAAGEAMLQNIAVTDLFRQAGAVLWPTIYANAVPCGTLKREAFLRLAGDLVERLPDAARLDGVWLYLHGAMNVEGLGSGELALLKMVREKVGWEVPVAVALDFHANLPPELMDTVNVVCGYKTAPHADMRETQIKAGECLLRCIREGLRPRPVIEKIPMMLSGDTVITAEEPMRGVMERAAALAGRPDILDISVFSGQSWVDAPQAGACVVVSPAGPVPDAKELARDVARRFWDARRDFRFQVPALEPAEAVALAAASPESPVFVSDSGDNTTAGAAGDSTELLRHLLEQPAPCLAAGITDRPFVEAFWDCPAGTALTASLGGTLDPANPRLTLEAVLGRSGRSLGWDGFDAGRAVVVRSGQTDVLVTENRCSIISPEILLSMGLDFRDYKIVAVKLGYLYPKLAAAAPKAVLAFTSGSSCVAIEKLKFREISRPMFPIDANTVYTIGE